MPQHTCTSCGKSFKGKIGLRRHMHMHTGASPYQCEQCHASFGYIGNLKRHMRIHTGEKPFACKICGRQFSDDSHRKSHERIHISERRERGGTSSEVFHSSPNTNASSSPLIQIRHRTSTASLRKGQERKPALANHCHHPPAEMGSISSNSKLGKGCSLRKRDENKIVEKGTCNYGSDDSSGHSEAEKDEEGRHGEEQEGSNSRVDNKDDDGSEDFSNSDSDGDSDANSHRGAGDIHQQNTKMNSNTMREAPAAPQSPFLSTRTKDTSIPKAVITNRNPTSSAAHVASPTPIPASTSSLHVAINRTPPPAHLCSSAMPAPQPSVMHFPYPNPHLLPPATQQSIPFFLPQIMLPATMLPGNGNGAHSFYPNHMRPQTTMHLSASVSIAPGGPPNVLNMYPSQAATPPAQSAGHASNVSNMPSQNTHFSSPMLMMVPKTALPNGQNQDISHMMPLMVVPSDMFAHMMSMAPIYSMQPHQPSAANDSQNVLHPKVATH